MFFVNAVKKTAANLRNFFKENPLEAKTEYGQALLEAMNKAENRVQELWDKAVAEGIRADKAESRIKYMARNANIEFAFGENQESIDKYVDKAYIKENTVDYKKYAVVSNKLLNDVSDDIDLTNYAHAIRDNDIRHIRNSHGEQSGEKYPVTSDDLKLIPYIVSFYDKVIAKKNQHGNPGLVYVKVTPDNLIYYLEAVTESYGNEPLLVNKQMIKTGIDDIPKLSGLKDAIIKKQSETEFLADLKQIYNDLVQTHKAYAQSEYQSNSYNNTIPDNTKKINTPDEKSSDRFTDPVTYDDDGNVIPLSERFNEDKGDIRYSDRPDPDYFDELFDMGDDLFEDESKRQTLNELIDKYPDDALSIIKHAVEQTIENVLTKTKSIKLDDKAYLSIAWKFMQDYNISRVANPGEDAYLVSQLKNIVARVEAGELTTGEDVVNEIIEVARDALMLGGTLIILKKPLCADFCQHSGFIFYQFSICLPKNAAADCASLISGADGTFTLSELSITTAPITSPEAIIG